MGKVKTPRRQRTVMIPAGKARITVVGRWYYGAICGFDIKVVLLPNTVILETFHNGAGLANPFSIDNALEFITGKLLEGIPKP